MDANNKLLWVNRGTNAVPTSGQANPYTLSYDGGGLRVAKSDAWTGSHNFSWGPTGMLCDSSGSTVFTPGLAQRQNGVDRFVHEDWLGSLRYLTDSTGNNCPSAMRMDAYGRRTLTGGTDSYNPTPFQWASGGATRRIMPARRPWQDGGIRSGAPAVVEPRP